jgi:hypothetical protein
MLNYTIQNYRKDAVWDLDLTFPSVVFSTALLEAAKKKPFAEQRQSAKSCANSRAEGFGLCAR